MGKYKVMRCKMKGAFDLLATAYELDFVYLAMIKPLYRNGLSSLQTFAMRVLSIPECSEFQVMRAIWIFVD